MRYNDGMHTYHLKLDDNPIIHFWSEDERCYFFVEKADNILITTSIQRILDEFPDYYKDILKWIATLKPLLNIVLMKQMENLYE